MELNFNVIGLFIRYLRESNYLTQKELAEELNVSDAGISQWESGSGIKTEQLIKISEFFDITLDELIEGKFQDEDETDAFLRNLNINRFERFDSITKDNYLDVRDYLDCCNRLNEYLMDMLSNYINNREINTKNRIIRILKEFYNYFGYTIDRSVSYDESINLSIERISTCKSLEEIKFETNKCFGLNTGFNQNDVVEFEDKKIILSFCKLMGKVVTDYIFNYCCEFMSDRDLLLSMMSIGAQYTFSHKSLRSIHEIEVGHIKYIDGKTLSLVDFDLAQSILNPYDIQDIVNKISYRDYKKLCSISHTSLLKNKLLNFENNPKEYFNNYKEHYTKSSNRD